MDKEITRIKKQLKEMQAHLPVRNQKKENVSAANVGWHISHNLLVLENVLQALEHSDPQKIQEKNSVLKIFILVFRRIPRGKAKAPSAVVPGDNYEAAALENQIIKINKKLPQVKELPKKAFFAHPYFGDLSRDKTMKFLAIHTEHHLKIIRDILK